MKKYQKLVMSSLTGLLLVASPLANVIDTVYATSDNVSKISDETHINIVDDDIQELKYFISKVQNYIGINGNQYFDENLARENNESQEIIDIGVIYNDMLYAEKVGDYEKTNKWKSGLIDKLTRYGNWCGKGNNGKAPIDLLDAQCKKHDNCYSKNGMWNSSCDVKFVHDLASNFGAIKNISKRARNYAIGAIVLFGSKVGGTAALKSKYPILRPFLP